VEKNEMIETTELFSLFSLFWVEAHCFHNFRTDSPTEQSEIVKTVSFQILPKQ